MSKFLSLVVIDDVSVVLTKAFCLLFRDTFLFFFLIFILQEFSCKLMHICNLTKSSSLQVSHLEERPEFLSYQQYWVNHGFKVLDLPRLN